MNKLTKQIIFIFLFLSMYCSIIAQNNNIPLDSNKVNVFKVLFNPFIIGRYGTNDFECFSIEYEMKMNSSNSINTFVTYKPTKKYGYYSNYYLGKPLFIPHPIKQGIAWEFYFSGKKYFGANKTQLNGIYVESGIGYDLMMNRMINETLSYVGASRLGISSGYQSSIGQFYFDTNFLNFYFITPFVNKNDRKSYLQYKFYFSIGYKF